MRPTLPEGLPAPPEGLKYYGKGKTFSFGEKQSLACFFHPLDEGWNGPRAFSGNEGRSDLHFAGHSSPEMDALNGWSDEAPFAETSHERHLPHHLANVQDLVNQPPHYKQGEIECIDAIRSALTPEEFRGYCKGNALKYTWREKHKGQDQDLEKARRYLQMVTEEKPRDT